MKTAVPPVTPLIDCAPGWTESPVMIVISTDPMETPAADADTVHLPLKGTVVGAVKFAVAIPFVVCAKGLTEPHVAVKFTEVPSNTGPPEVSCTPAVMVEVVVVWLACKMVGEAVRDDVVPEIVTGWRKREIRLEALWLFTVTEAVTFMTDPMFVRAAGST